MEDITNKDFDTEIILNNIILSIKDHEKQINNKNNELSDLTKKVKNKSFLWILFFLIKNYLSKIGFLFKNAIALILAKTEVNNISTYFITQGIVGSIVPIIIGFIGYIAVSQTIKITNMESKLNQANTQIIELKTKSEDLEKQNKDLLTKIDSMPQQTKEKESNFGSYNLNLKDGDKLSGVIIKKDEEYIYLKLIDQTVRKIAKDDIYSLTAK